MKINFINTYAIVNIVSLIILVTIFLVRNSFDTIVIVIFSMAIFGIILSTSSCRYFIHEKAKTTESFTFVLIFSVVIIMLLFIIFRDSVFGTSIDSMTPKLARFYYEQIITALVGLFTGFLMGVTMLWVSFKPVYEKGKRIGGKPIRTLTKHTTFLFLLIGYVFCSIYFGILLDLSKQVV